MSVENVEKCPTTRDLVDAGCTIVKDAKDEPVYAFKGGGLIATWFSWTKTWVLATPNPFMSKPRFRVKAISQKASS